METRVSTDQREVIIGDGRPTVLIGERINLTGKKSLAAALQAGDLTPLIKEALDQVQAGADILDVNVATSDLDESALLPLVVEALREAADVPLCLDSKNPEALEAALKTYRGKPLVNSVSYEQSSLKEVLPLVRKYRAAVIALPIDQDGVPEDADQRVALIRKILERAESLGIPREDVVADPLALTVGADNAAALITLETIRKIWSTLGLNVTLGASNISFGLPDRELVNSGFLPIAIAAGVNCPILDVAKLRPLVLATDLLMGRDKNARRYIEAYTRRRRKH